MRRTSPLVLLLVTALLAAGCGSSKKKTSAPPATTAAATTTAAGTTALTSTGKLDLSKADSSCKKMILLAAQYQKAFVPAAGGDISKSLATASVAMNAFVNAAPSEIRGDLKALADAFGKEATALKGLTPKPGVKPSAAQIAKLTQAEQAITAPALRAHITHIQAWEQQHCGGAKS
jgi:hypothetical protein